MIVPCTRRLFKIVDTQKALTNQNRGDLSLSGGLITNGFLKLRRVAEILKQLWLR